jgi:hypothetical protein
MAQRPIFTPVDSPPFSFERSLEFQWFPGLSTAQQRRSIAALHESASVVGIAPLLEISSKSTNSVGVRLSAFNLMVRFGDTTACVEAWFQGGKVFEHGGPFLEFLRMQGREIKVDERLRSSGRLREFRLGSEIWPLSPRTAFYDWLYLHALVQNPVLSEQLHRFSGFTDIAFNPGRSLNCQARSAALFVGLARAGRLDVIGQGRDAFVAEVYGHSEASADAATVQTTLLWASADAMNLPPNDKSRGD